MADPSTASLSCARRARVIGLRQVREAVNHLPQMALDRGAPGDLPAAALGAAVSAASRR
jgi:hypothetical protein